MKQASFGLALLMGLLPVATAQADELPWWMGERRIIGDNNLEPIEDASGTDLYNYARAVARVEDTDGEGFCTASRVSDDLFLTNFHCYEYKPCNQVQFRMGYEAGISADEQQVFTCTEVLSKSLVLDYALYQVTSSDDDNNDPEPPADAEVHDFLDLDLAIPDGTARGLDEPFRINQAGSIISMSLALKVSHSWVGDLVVSLVSPAGTEIVLQNRVGSSDDSIDQVFAITDVVGENSFGTWRLKISDHARRDTGILEDVSFIIETASREETVRRPVTYPKLAFWAGAIEENQLLIAAGHPSARAKEIDRGDECKVRTVEVEEVAERRTITHTCDTEGGSSGSPMLDRATGRIVALHWGGTNDYNFSIPIHLILADLEANLSPEEFAKLTIFR